MIAQWQNAQFTTLWLQVRAPLIPQLFYALIAFFCLTWVQIRKFTNFKVQKHHDSQELSIPDYGHLDGYFMENILAYANSAPHIALKMTLFYSKMKHF